MAIPGPRPAPPAWVRSIRRRSRRPLQQLPRVPSVPSAPAAAPLPVIPDTVEGRQLRSSVRSAYREALGRLAAGREADALAAVAALEDSLLTRKYSAATLEQLVEIETGAALELATADPAVLAPLLRLHQRLYEEAHIKRRHRGSTVAREIAGRLTDFCRERGQAEKTNIDVMVTVGVNGKAHNYQSMIITGKNSGIKSMEDVVAHSHDLTLSFADPASASGHLIPRAYLKTLGLDAKSSFRETIFTNGHIASAMAVKAGKVDLGCTVVILNQMLQDRGMLKPDDLVVLWISDPIVTEPIVIRSDVNKQFAEKVKQAYLDLPATVPNVWKAYTNKIYTEDSLTYIVAHDSLYNGIRKLSAGLIDTKVVQ